LRHASGWVVLIAALIAVVWTGPAVAEGAHWAFVKPVRPAVPRVAHAASVRNSVDAFVLKSLESRGLTPSPPADRRALIRRVTFDLTGLPPTPSEIAAFLADSSPNAYDRVVSRLLASPHFGERWAQHWLDVVRFGESNGYEHDGDRPQAWRYRDWVVAAFNSDMPYDRFVKLQVAGDLLAPNDFQARVATGFLRAGPYHITGGNLDPVDMRQEWLTEAVAGIGNGILGLTIGCARCHDHKYDPIPQADYYRMQAFFAAAADRDDVKATDAEKAAATAAEKAIKARTAPIDAQIAEIEGPVRARLREEKRQALPPEYKAALAIDSSRRTAAQKKLASEASTQLNISWDEVVNALPPADRARRAALRQQVFAIERELPAPLPTAEGVTDVILPPPATHLLVRGDIHNPGQEVQPGSPSCIPAPDQLAVAPGENPRLTLVRWLTAPDNCLTSRVFVNRLWHYLFGRGIVATPNDFGRHGQVPTDPALLDWLATTFSGQQRWSVKEAIRLLVTSNTYRQSAEFDAKKAAIDPENRLLWRMNRRRLDAEALRDSILSAAGTINLQVGGPSVRIPLEPEVYDTIFSEYEPDNLWPVTPDAGQHTRRTLYLVRKRNVRLPMLAVFDQPDMMSSCAARGQTVHALQALTLLNSGFMRAQSYALAARVWDDPVHGLRRFDRAAGNRAAPVQAAGGDNAGARIDRLFEVALGRPPVPKERQAAARFLADQAALARAAADHGDRADARAYVPNGAGAAEFAALADLCLATMNSNEFAYIR